MTKLFRNALSIILSGLLLLTPLAPFVAAAGVSFVRLELSSPNGSVVQQGDTVYVDVIATGNDGFCAMTLLIDYDYTALELVHKSNGTVADDAHFTPNQSLESGVATLAWQNFTATQDWTNTGLIARLTFTVKSNAPTGDRYVRVSPVANAGLSTRGDSVAELGLEATTTYIQVVSSEVSSERLDLYVSSEGSSSNDGLSAVKAKKTLNEALQYVADHEQSLGNKTVVVHLFGNVYSTDPSTGGTDNRLGLAGIKRTVTVTSTNASLPGTLIHAYNYNGAGLTDPAIILQNSFTLENVNFAAFAVTAESATSRDFYCDGHDFTVGENCSFVNAQGGDLSFNVYGGGVAGDTAISKNYSVSLASGTWDTVAPLMTRGGRITSAKVYGTVTGNAAVNKFYAGPSAAGDKGTNAFYFGEPLTSNAYMTISGFAVVSEYLGGCGNFAEKENRIIGNVLTSVEGSPTVASFFGGGDYGTRSGTITNVIRGGTFTTNFYGGGWGLNNSDKGTTADISTAIYAGTFKCSVYGAGYYTPTVGDVELFIAGDGVNNSSNRTYIGEDKGVYGGSGSLYASVTGNVYLTLNGAYFDATVYGAGRGNVYGDVHVNNYNTCFLSTRNLWLGNHNTGGSVYGDVYFRMTGGSIPNSFYACGYRSIDNGTGRVNGNAYLDISGGTINKFFISANCDPNASTPLYGRVLGNCILNVDVSRNDVKISNLTYMDGLLIDRLTGGSGILTVPSNKYVVANHFSGNALKVVSSGFTKTGALLTLPCADVDKVVSSVSVKVGGSEISHKISDSGRERIWYKTAPTSVINSFSLIPDDQLGMRVIFENNTPTANGEYQYSLDGGNTYQTVTYDTGASFDGLSGTHATFVIPGIEPSHFNDTILFRPSDAVAPVPYSVSGACLTVIDSKESGSFVFDQGFRELAQSILNYGGAAQDYYEYNPSSKAVAKNPVSLNTFDTWSDVTFVGTSVVSGIKAKPAGVSLVLADSVSLQVYFKVDASVDISALSVKVNGKTVSGSLTRRDDHYCTFAYTVSGRDISTVYTFQVFNGTTPVSNTFRTSVGSYCAMIQAKTNGRSGQDASLLALCESIGAMFHYRASFFNA